MKKRFLSSDPDASLPIRLSRRRIYILPTGQGVLFLLVLFGMLLGSINYNNNLGFLLVFLLGSMTLVSIIHTWRNLLGLTVSSVTAAPVFAGDSAAFQVVTRSETLQRKGITVGFENEARTIDTIEAGTDTTATVTAATTRRGRYYPGKLIIATRFPLGLFRAWSNLDTGSAVIVYPKPVAGPFRLTDDFDPGDAEEAIESGGVDDFKGLKQYQPGDAIQHIAWKTLSRGQGVFTKEFAGDASPSVVIDYNSVRADSMEYKLCRLSDMVLQASQMNVVYGLKLPDHYLPPDNGTTHKHECLRALALFGIDE